MSDTPEVKKASVPKQILNVRKSDISPMKMSIFNARSLKNKTDLVNDYRSEHNLDIMLFTECWLNDSDPEIGEFENNGDFRFILKPRLGRQGGGVGCLHRSNLPVKKIETKASVTFEHMALDINSRLTVILVYRPEPSLKNPYTMSQFYDEFTELVSHFVSDKRELLITGDFNFHMNCPRSGNTVKFNDVLQMFDLIQHVKGPTHIAGNTLDLVITRPNCPSIHSCKVDELISDHNAILVELNLSTPCRVKRRIRYRKTRNIDSDLFKLDLKNFFSAKLNKLGYNHINEKHLNDLISAYEGSVEVLDKHAPVKEKVITVRKPTPWNTDDIKSYKAAKRKAEKKWRKTKCDADLATFKEKRNLFNSHLKDLRRKDLAKKIGENKGNSKALFKIMNKALHRKQDLPLPPQKDDETLATEFSDFFEKKISDIRQKLDTTNNCSRIGPNISNGFLGTYFDSFKRMRTDEIRKIISDMAPKHSALDHIPTWIVKNHLDEFLPIITQIVNTSLELGIMPKSLKHAIVKPLLKKLGLDPLLKNYRPVSNLKFLSKIIEGAVIQQYTNHLSENELHDARQSAYKPFHSTETLLTKIHNDIMLNGNKGEVTMLVLLDLSAAFDTIDHQILIERLEKTHGITGTALQWFKSYLCDRTQSVIINDTESASKKLKFGVPQGSKLGPILFNSYIAPLSDVAQKHNIDDQKYADDEQLLLAFTPNISSTSDAICRMENCIKDIRLFLHRNKLCNNGDKTEIIVLGPKSKLKDLGVHAITVDNVSIAMADKVRNLGVILDKNLTMENQVVKMCQAAYLNIRNIARIRVSMNYDDTKTVVNALVTPHLDYGNGLLYGVSGKLIKKLQVAQNSAVRLIEKLKKHDHVTDKRKDLHWLPIPARIEYKLMTLTWKIVNNQAPKYLSDLINNKTYCRLLRNSNKMLLNIPRLECNNSWGNRAFCISSPTLWNKLPPHIRQKRTLDSFKKSLKTHLFNIHYNLR